MEETKRTSYASALKHFLIPIAEWYREIYISNDKQVAQLSGIELLNYLKDEYKFEKIFNNMTMRELLQVLGTEILREVYADIHIIFKAYDILKDGEVKYVMSDIRFFNELLLALNLNIREKPEERKSYLLYQLEKINQIDVEDIKAQMKLKFKITDEAFKSDTIINQVFQNIKNKIKNIKDEVKKQSIQKLEGKELTIHSIHDELNTCENWEEIYEKYGIVNVFRPIINLEEKVEVKNELEVYKIINKFTGFNNDKITGIKKFYEMTLGEGSFTIENIHKYGFQRANFGHVSETQLRDVIPHSFVNYPFNTKESKKAIEELEFLFSSTRDKKTVTIITGAAGHGKDEYAMRFITVSNPKSVEQVKRKQTNGNISF